MKVNGFISFLLCCTIFLTLPAYSLNPDELLASEKNTVELFQKYSPKVVYVHRLTTIGRTAKGPKQVPSGAGSGIIWDAAGHIVTNFHVIKGAENLAVTLGTLTVPVKVIGAEPRKDIAVLAIKSPKALHWLKSYVPFEMAKTSQLMVGQKTIAIGNPYGLDHSLSLGVISALARQMPGIGGVKIQNMVQTDASINPGNSGGPLLDSRGHLIGLNTLIYSNTGSSNGIGFAVPADDIARFVPQIISKGRVVLPGIGIQWANPNISKRLGVKRGVLVAKVLPKTPAARVGLKGMYHDNWGRLHAGDVIVALNEHPITNYDNLYNLLASIKVGDGIKLTVQRKGMNRTFKMKTIDIAAYI